MTTMPEENQEPQTNIYSGYIASQISKALATSEDHPNAATRERAEGKIRKWLEVIDGIMAGKLAIGARQPVRDVPTWATLEVVTGGFATGGLMAGGELGVHEKELLKRIPAAHQKPRQTLNRYFLTEPGLSQLLEQLQTSNYAVTIPEEGALLVVAWLAAHGHMEQASGLIETLAPFFAELRFYPARGSQTISKEGRVHLESVGAVMARLRSLETNQHVLAQREAIQVWTPLYDRMIALFEETVTGDLPAIQPDSEGRWVSPVTKKFAVAGGWPCQRYPADWSERALAVVADCERERKNHQLCGKPERSGDSFSKLAEFLKVCANRPGSLTGRDVGMIRLILARHGTKRGGPHSEEFKQLRARQQRQAAAPTRSEIAEVIAGRMTQFPPADGLDSVDAIVQPVTVAEAEKSKIPVGTLVSRSMARKVARCLSARAETLIYRGIISSGDTLARVIPLYTAGIVSSAFEDEQLKTLYAAIYCAFSRRRSLLLLNLERQVRLEELPWVSAINGFRTRTGSAAEASRQALKELAALTFRYFPHAIVPNPLLKEFGALSRAAELHLPLVEELAADIFMGDFSPKFTAAAKASAAHLRGSLYARYFKVDVDAVLRLPHPKLPEKKKSFGRPTETISPELVNLCGARAGTVTQGSFSVAHNGTVIEQAQILTTHNLAVLFNALGLGDELRAELRGMAEACFRWICKRQQVKSEHGHAKLVMLKNTAFAWRQMIFYLSQLPDQETEMFLEWAKRHLNEQTDEFAIRFAPAMQGLEAAYLRKTGMETGSKSVGEKIFLGWTTGKHWLLGSK